MKHAEISRIFTDIKNQVMKGKSDSAIEKLEAFISEIDDDILENQIVSLSSRYNRFQREKIQGTISEESRIELNSIDASLMNLLREAKQAAIEKASMMVGSQLSELAEEGSNAIEELKKLNMIIAESRLLELQVIRATFGTFFSVNEIEKFDQNIDSLKKVLNKENDEELYKENSTTNFITKLHENFEKFAPDNKPSIDDMINLAHQMRNIMMSDFSNTPQSSEEE